MIEPGQAGAYLALFSEIGIVLLVTTLLGALAGNWIDNQLTTAPFLTLAGFLAGAGRARRVWSDIVERTQRGH